MNLSPSNYVVSSVAMQPTTFCNLECSYCYLYDKASARRMTPAVAEAVANSLQPAAQPIRVIWHAGEPLSSGIRHFESLLAPFDQLRSVGAIKHVVQSNATLIDADWCKLFADHQFHVGISIDGPEWATASRKHRSGKEAFPQIIRGIENLKTKEIPFSTIAVVGPDSFSRAAELYDFFVSLGCTSVGFNIEEAEGANLRDPIDDDVGVRQFWRDLFSAWKDNPAIEVREFSNSLAWFLDISRDVLQNRKYHDIFPTVAWNGDVTILSPELLGAKSDTYGDFIVGNVLHQTMDQIMEGVRRSALLDEILLGISRCEAECEFFSFCRGGQPSNKFFEAGRFDVTETSYCRNTVKRLATTIFSSVTSTSN